MRRGQNYRTLTDGVERLSHQAQEMLSGQVPVRGPEVMQSETIRNIRVAPSASTAFAPAEV
jgi:hypothetical protein